MYVPQHVRNLKPYVPGKSSNELFRESGLNRIVKLASNESPLAPSANIIAAMQAACANVHIYPDASGTELAELLGTHWQVESSWIGLGNGSNEIIDLLIRTFSNPGDRVMASDCSFIAYQVCTLAADREYVSVPIANNLQIDLTLLAKRAIELQPKLLFLPNPNNPTGGYLPKSEVIAFLEAMRGLPDCLIVLDEAYNEFVRAESPLSAKELLLNYSNLCICRTFSKVYGLAGLRLGALIARPELLQFYHRVRNPFNVNSVAQAAAGAAIADREYLSRVQEMIWQGIDLLNRELPHLGLKVYPSQANFVLFDTLRDAQLVFNQLLKKGLILRPLQPYGLKTHLRMTVGTHSENEFAIEVLAKVLATVETIKPARDFA